METILLRPKLDENLHTTSPNQKLENFVSEVWKNYSIICEGFNKRHPRPLVSYNTQWEEYI
jgi:hypothetical protein